MYHCCSGPSWFQCCLPICLQQCLIQYYKCCLPLGCQECLPQCFQCILPQCCYQCCLPSCCLLEKILFGLPNIGNTCYLNATIQMLFSATKFKDCIKEQSKKNPSLKFHKILSQVFEDLEKDESIRKKQTDLEQLLNYLHSKQPQFVIGKQNDAFQCYLSILNILQKENEQIKDLFKIEYLQACTCSSFIAENCFLASDIQNLTCKRCKKKISFTIVSSGSYLTQKQIKTQKGNFSPQIIFKNKEQDFIYNARSLVLYSGNQQSGHYISCRKMPNENKWYESNDLQVRQINNPSNSKNVAMVLYEKTQK